MKVFDNGDGTFKGVISPERECLIVPSKLQGFYNLDFPNGKKAYFYTMFEIEEEDFAWKYKSNIKDRTGAEQVRPDGSRMFVRDYRDSHDMEVILYRNDEDMPTFFHHISWSVFRNNLIPIKFKKKFPPRGTGKSDTGNSYNGFTADGFDSGFYNDSYLSGYEVNTVQEMISKSQCNATVPVGKEPVKEVNTPKVQVKVGQSYKLPTGVEGIVLSESNGKYRMMTSNGIKVFDANDFAPN